ncbi:MAG: N-acetylornithine carbamoyltransferase [Flavobacteriaceae bacterium]|nr:N-acetylornithine carbamoyltransferase [Flavobacteriaceae bacterium]
MKKFLSISDIPDLDKAIKNALELKEDSMKFSTLGKGKNLVMVFFNPSLRTRFSTKIAAQNLGLGITTLDVAQQTWPLEFGLNTIMDGHTSEHIKEAAMVLSSYFDLIAVRSFPQLKNRDIDLKDVVLKNFSKYATVPIINMESATAHPLQSFADAITIRETKINNPKIVLSWAPHPKSIPHSVPNSFVKMCKQAGMNLVIANPPGYDLDPTITSGIKVFHHQEESFENADIIYSKNWSSYESYGQVLPTDQNWMIDLAKMDLTNRAKFMHCLPVRRNVVVEDEVLDSEHSLIQRQVQNRTVAAQYVMHQILTNVPTY